MADQGSTYAVLQSVPVMVSPLYKLPKKILVASELQMVPDDFTKLSTYPFSVERDVISQVEAARKQSLEAEEALKLKKKQYEEERINKQKVAARKIAPGFLDTDTRILKPEQTYVYEHPLVTSNSEGSKKIEEEGFPVASKSTNGNSNVADKYSTYSPDKLFDYQKFEQGLAPADPWDTPENDMAALSSILGSPKNDYSPKRTSTPPTYPPQQYQHSSHQHHLSQPPALAHSMPQHHRLQPHQKNEGVYWSFQSTTPQRTADSPVVLPALPPKLFNSSPLPTSSMSSPVISPSPPPPLPPNNYKSNSNSPTPPPLPPLPQPQNEDLINELENMGFTRAQAIDALENNDHDLIKATNFLLDQA